MIELNNVNFTYKGTDEAGLHDLSLTIPDGETLLLCGESGCGKTTLTRLINGLIPHYYKGDLSGTVSVNGRNISETQLYELAGTVGTVFQNPRSQFFSIDTDGEIVFGPENIGMSPADILKRKEQVSDDMELSPLLGRSLFELSGGEKQKIACASVSALMPDIMILDEPSSNLDWKAIDELKNIISMWKDQSKTVIISEHRLWYLSGLVDRVLFMRKGVIAHEWSRDEFAELGTEELKSLGLRPTKLEEKYIKEFGEGIFGETINAVKQYKHGKNDIQIRDMYFSYRQQKRSISEKKNSDEERTLSIPELSLPKASVIALTGKNGAGKSTFLRCLCGLEKRCKVRLEIDGTGYSRKHLLKKCYMVMQDVNHQLFTDSVTAEVCLSMKDEDTEKCDRILDSLGLLEFRDKHPMALSGGQKQRIAIASALAADADLLLFDEPTSGLDYAHMTAVAKLLKQLSSDGKAVIVSTHDPELIALCCDYVLCIEHGKVKYFREA